MPVCGMIKVHDADVKQKATDGQVNIACYATRGYMLHNYNIVAMQASQTSLLQKRKTVHHVINLLHNFPMHF